MQAERRKKKLVYFLSRGAAYLGPKVKDISERRKKKLVYFLSRGAAYLGPKVKDSVLFLTKYNNVVCFLSKFAADKKIIIKNHIPFMIYSKEVENMCVVQKGPKHGPAPIPEEGKWIKAKEIKDISGYTHGIGWCAPQQGACKLSLNI